LINSPADGCCNNDNWFLNLLNRSNIIIVTAAIAAEVTSVICLFRNTKTGPTIAPMAADVTPFTNALIEGCLPYFFIYEHYALAGKKQSLLFFPGQPR
jgi:hypothetical protein